jgi:RNA polymerase sigma-70 factor (ECF subfamily)
VKADLDPREADAAALACRRGDPRALARLYRVFAPPLLAYLQRAGGDRSEAEDVLHETFLRLITGRGRYRAQGRFRSWLFTVATRLLYDRQRKQRRRDLIIAEDPAELAPRPAVDPQRRLEARELHALVRSALADLPASYAAALQLRVREGFSYAEMVAITGEPAGTLRSRVHHVLKHLRRRLRAADDPHRALLDEEEKRP